MLCLNKSDMATNDNHGLGILLPGGILRIYQQYQKENTQCGLNHESKDFIHKILLLLIVKLETNDKFIDFLHKKHMIRSKEEYEYEQRRMSKSIFIRSLIRDRVKTLCLYAIRVH